MPRISVRVDTLSEMKRLKNGSFRSIKSKLHYPLVPFQQPQSSNLKVQLKANSYVSMG
ncbi:hypothetical protein AXF42_Ash008430 [Apostasia shenzhenica]|uniref:Uncharacterized protein n=1 Tax=Apostasia shenzhenica TaxID=1088818 RepID=A0A2I0AXU2_9ASPA|nr:hypothetical protein AXF42_Ash008430 [Apostasia shenzhenica]